jgi:alpha-mannosidase
MEILSVVSTNLFVGTEDEPHQVVRVRLRGSDADASAGAATVRIEGGRVRTENAKSIGPLLPGEEGQLEIGVSIDGPAGPGDVLGAELVVDGGTTPRFPFDLAAAEPGWRMFMVSHFHYDPVWWNTQAAYTETWGAAIQYRQPFQEPGLALVKAHLEMARRDPEYKFVLAELDYLKPYWDVYPEDREYMRRLMDEDRLELMGGTYNEPNTNLTSAESTIRNALYGIGYQRDVLGGRPATAWQLDAFGHDPQFPGIMARAGITSSSWARGPFHEWGPNWIRGPGRMRIAELAEGSVPRMQFATEFDWVAPSGRALLTSFMADHYSAGWWMDSAVSLDEAESEVHSIFTELSQVAATRNVLLPVGTDYTPPNKWLTAIHRDWNRRYVWPKFIAALPREFFAAVRAERKTGRAFTPQTRDMNPVYTGKDVSFIDTKQAQRVAENTLLGAEKFATIAGLLGARFPTEAIDKAWRQLLFGAHHDGITGSESDQVYLDLLGGWRESLELGQAALDSAVAHISGSIDTTGEGRAVTVFNTLSWPRTDIARVVVDVPGGSAGIEVQDDSGSSVPLLVEAAERDDSGQIIRAALAFLARGVPAIGYRTYRIVASETSIAEAGWREASTTATIENDAYALTVDQARGGTLTSLVAKEIGKDLIQPGRVANELLCYREYPNHPMFGEGPWHLTPDGRVTSSVDHAADARVEECAIGRRIVIDGPFESCRRHQEVVLWDGLDRVEFRTRLDDYDGQDRLFRVRFPVAVEGGRPISETGNATVARGFGFPNVDVAEVPFTLDNPAYNWFGIGATAKVALVEPGSGTDESRSERAIGIAEIVATSEPELDPAVRALLISLVRQGVTATVSSHDRDRYGVLHIDSNLPDVRIAIGGPSENEFVDGLLDEPGDDYRKAFERQIADEGQARLWIPAVDEQPRTVSFPDLRASRALPVLVVAGRDTASTIAAVEALADDFGDGCATVVQAKALDGSTGGVEDLTVAILNRGLPGFNVEPDGSLYLSLMRSCSGWPSGVWINPPRRSAPDGSNFQFQHWSHTFEYALTAKRSDWRDGQIVEQGHAFNNALVTRVVDSHPGRLPASTSFLEVQPSSAVVTALKPAGNPQVRMASMDLQPTEGLALRIYESSGRPSSVSIGSSFPFAAAASTNVVEEAQERSLPVRDGAVHLELEPYEIATVRVQPAPAPNAKPGAQPGAQPATTPAPRAEPAQPVFSDYWMHNKGAAPIGYQPVTVQIRPRFIEGAGSFSLPIVVASERTDVDTAGTVRVVVPTGWEATPPERQYRLAPGSHVAFDTAVAPSPNARPGRYFVAAQIADDSGQVHEDVVTIDLVDPASREADGGNGAAEVGSISLAMSIARALRTAGIEPGDGNGAGSMPALERGGELGVNLATSEIEVDTGGKATLALELRNLAASEIRGEAQIISPHETWSSVRPWTQGFTVGAGESSTLTFDIQPSFDTAPGTYWVLVKVMYFGRLHYTEAIRVAIRPREPVSERTTAPVAGAARGS